MPIEETPMRQTLPFAVLMVVALAALSACSERVKQDAPAPKTAPMAEAPKNNDVPARKATPVGAKSGVVKLQVAGMTERLKLI